MRGSCRRPLNISAYIRATRAGVSRRPSRSGSSPTAARISRTARSMRGRSGGTAASLVVLVVGAEDLDMLFLLDFLAEVHRRLASERWSRTANGADFAAVKAGTKSLTSEA